MEGEGEIPLPEGGGGGSMTKIIAAIVVIIIVVAAIAGALLLMGGETENEIPTAEATASSSVVVVGQSVNFDGTESEDPDGETLTYVWNFGDGTTDNETGAVVSHTYQFPGKYLIFLTVTDEDGAIVTNWESPVQVEVLNPEVEEIDNDTLPYVIVAASAQVIENGTLVEVDGASSAAYEAGSEEPSSELIEEMVWHWGDGESDTGNFTEASTANYTYTGNGSIYASYLLVTSVHDAAQRYYHTIAVLPLGQAGGTGVKNPDTFVTATIGEPRTLDPAVAYDSASGEVLQNVYETLVWYDRESAAALIPKLASVMPTTENGGISDDALNYTFVMRSGVSFHATDGEGNNYIMDGYDVEYSIERVLTMNDPEGPVWMLAQLMYPDWPGPGIELDTDLVDATVTVNPDDPMEVTFHLLNPYPAFLAVMAYTIGSVVCMEYVEANGGGVPIEQNDHMKRAEAGTGPYQLVSWEANQYVLMQRFDDYWGGPAPLKYVIIKKVNDTGTRLMMLTSGDADWAYVPRQQRESVLDNDDLRIVEGLPTFDMGFYGFNLNMSGDLDVGDVPLDFFADMNIRNAFIHAFNFETFLEDILAGTGIQPNGPIPMGMFGYTPDVPNYTYDLALAAEFLNKTPYAATGFHIILYYNTGNDEREAACFLLEEGLENLDVPGEIEVTVQALEWPTYLGALYGKALPVFFLGWAPDYADPDDYVNPFLHSNGAFPYFLSLSNATLDEMIMDAAMELNQTLRAEMYADISWACYENAYYLWTSQTTNFHVERAWVTGYYFNPMYSGQYYYVLDK